MKVYIIELRERHLIDRNYWEITVMHVASSEERALKWCDENISILTKNISTDILPWFAVSEEVVDGGFNDSEMLFFYDKNGKRESQPIM